MFYSAKFLFCVMRAVVYQICALLFKTERWYLGCVNFVRLLPKILVLLHRIIPLFLFISNSLLTALNTSFQLIMFIHKFVLCHSPVVPAVPSVLYCFVGFGTECCNKVQFCSYLPRGI
jgi:hypothetical protein